MRRYSLPLFASVWSAQPAAQTVLEVLPAQGHVHMVAGPGGNMAVQAGHEAVVLVDTLTDAVSEDVLAAIEALSPEPIRHIVLTSDDRDHTGGNAFLSSAGTYVRLIDSIDPRGSSANASINAYINVLNRMTGLDGEAYERPADAWPTDTYFTGSWELFVNGEAIRLIHVPDAYTDADTIVFFRRSDVIVTGDIFNTDRYPIFDQRRGGSSAGLIEGLNVILDLAIPGENQQGGTVVIPGHGRLADETDVINYRDMVTIVRDRIRAMIDNGMSLDDVIAARPTFDYDGIYTNAADDGSPAVFVAAIYRDLIGGAR